MSSLLLYTNIAIFDAREIKSGTHREGGEGRHKGGEGKGKVRIRNGQVEIYDIGSYVTGTERGLPCTVSHSVF